MWASEIGLNVDDPREIQRRQEAYARELDQQIAMRRLYQHKEQMEREELEHKLAPSERSPSKWLVEGGHLDVPETSQLPCQFRQSVKFHEEQRQDRGAATCEVSSVSSSSHPRFRVTDENESSQRLQERAQKMQWKRILDEQVEEKARLKEHDEAERRRSEENVAREEVRYLQEQQQQAQRRLGHFSPAVDAGLIKNGPEPKSPLPSPPELTASRQRNDLASTTNNFDNFAFTSDPREDKDKSTYYHRDQQNESPGIAEALAPSQIRLPEGNERNRLNDGGHDTVGRNRQSGLPARQPFSHGNDAQTAGMRSGMAQQGRIIEEYRLLLMEIRHEREELRRERDEVRREKEDLRVQRLLLQLENEKMATLVDAQRALNEQHELDLQTEQAQQLAQRQQYQAMAYQHLQSPVQAVGFKEDDTRKGVQRSRQQGHDPEIEAYSRLSPIQQTLDDINIHDKQPHPVSLDRRRKALSPLSMANFSAPTPNKRMTSNIVNAPGLSQYRSIPVVPAHDESVLDQSLVGDSVFVPLSPKSQVQSNNGPALRRCPKSPRVIKSRGFYDFDKDSFSSSTSEVACAQRKK